MKTKANQQRRIRKTSCIFIQRMAIDFPFFTQWFFCLNHLIKTCILIASNKTQFCMVIKFKPIVVESLRGRERRNEWPCIAMYDWLKVTRLYFKHVKNFPHSNTFRLQIGANNFFRYLFHKVGLSSLASNTKENTETNQYNERSTEQHEWIFRHVYI